MARNLKALLVASLTALACSACFRATFSDPKLPRAEETQERWAHHFALGLIRTEKIDIRDYCPSGRASEVRLGGDVLTNVMWLLTTGIYTPRKIVITCAPGEGR